MMLEPLFEEDVDLDKVEGELHDRFMDISKKMEEGVTDEWDLLVEAYGYDYDLYNFSWDITESIDEQMEHLIKKDYCEENPEDEWCEESDSSDDSSDDSSSESSDEHKDTDSSDESSDDQKDASEDEDEKDEDKDETPEASADEDEDEDETPEGENDEDENEDDDDDTPEPEA